MLYYAEQSPRDTICQVRHNRQKICISCEFTVFFPNDVHIENNMYISISTGHNWIGISSMTHIAQEYLISLH